MNKKSSISRELHLAGAKKAEIPGLLEIAGQLKRLGKQASSAGPKLQKRFRVLSLGLATVTGLLLGAALIASAQTSLPGSWPYPVKRVSERVAVMFDPSYRATVMMRRSQEVKDLVGRQASQRTVMATLADYRTEAATYKAPNYAAFEYCKSNLTQAASVAPESERSAITNTLSSLRS